MSAFGKPINREYTFDSEDLIGLMVILTVVERESEDGETYNKIDAVSSFVKQVPQPNPPPLEYEGEDW